MTTSRGPVRIQRRRARGWRMPPGTVCVGRPSRWGNPFAVGQVARPGGESAVTVCSPRIAVALFEMWLAGQPFEGVPAAPAPEQITEALAGRDLACWCRLDRPCHADVLLRVAGQVRSA